MINKKELLPFELNSLPIQSSFRQDCEEKIGYLRHSGCQIYLDKFGALVVIVPIKRVKKIAYIQTNISYYVINIANFLSLKGVRASKIEQEIAFGFDLESTAFVIWWKK
jgi:hypothetical protein